MYLLIDSLDELDVLYCALHLYQEDVLSSAKASHDAQSASFHLGRSVSCSELLGRLRDGDTSSLRS